MGFNSGFKGLKCLYYTKPEIKMKSLFKKCYVNEVFSKTKGGGKLTEES